MTASTTSLFIRCLGVIAAVVPFSVYALAPSERVPDFRLFDHAGGSQHLYYHTDKAAVVLLVQDTTCKSDASVAQAAAWQGSLGDDVQFMIVNPTQSRTLLQSDAAVQKSTVPILVDEAQLVGRTLGLNKAGEVLVVKPGNWELAYRGAADGGLQQVLSDLTGQEVDLMVEAPTSSCDIEYAAHDGAHISYTDTIAPILAENCVSCHRPGGIGPWAMTDYNLVRGFSLMMREVLMTQRMPPWHADPTVGHFSNDRSLTREQLQNLVSWIDAGAPRGEGVDPLPHYASARPVWGNLGEPDLIIDIPPTDVPATGVVDYQYKYVTNPLDEDVWVRASQIVPGERAVLHHVITRFGELETEGPRKGRLKNRSSIGGGLAGYVPGMEADPLPEGTGTLLPAGATIEFQMHYTTSGQPATDHSRIGVYFHKEPPEHRINAMVLADGRFKIPPHDNNYSHEVVREFKTDALIYSFLPHSHYRGKSARFVAQYPDGTEELLLNVPNYDFNWQTTYDLAEPKRVPAGTKIVFTKWWDNSAQNPANPDPSVSVTWGQQSFEEMIFGVVSYRNLKPEESEQGSAELAGAGQ